MRLLFALIVVLVCIASGLGRQRNFFSLNGKTVSSIQETPSAVKASSRFLFFLVSYLSVSSSSPPLSPSYSHLHHNLCFPLLTCSSFSSDIKILLFLHCLTNFLSFPAICVFRSSPSLSPPQSRLCCALFA